MTYSDCETAYFLGRNFFVFKNTFEKMPNRVCHKTTNERFSTFLRKQSNNLRSEICLGWHTQIARTHIFFGGISPFQKIHLKKCRKGCSIKKKTKELYKTIRQKRINTFQTEISLEIQTQLEKTHISLEVLSSF